MALEAGNSELSALKSIFFYWLNVNYCLHVHRKILRLDINDRAMKNNIGVERARVRMSQQELAEKTGVIRQTIAAIEQRRYNPSTVLALKIANIFNLSVEQLF